MLWQSEKDIQEFAFLDSKNIAQNNIDADYHLLSSVTDGIEAAPVARIWSNPLCLVVGLAISRLGGFEDIVARMEALNIPVLHRKTGGTVVPHGPGTLNVSLVLRYSAQEKSAKAAYMALCRLIVETLSDMGINADIGPVPGSYCDGDYNIRAQDRKLAGTAQRWRRCKDGSGDWAVLVHASITVMNSPMETKAVAMMYDALPSPYAVNLQKHVSCEEVSLKKGGANLSVLDLAHNIQKRLACSEVSVTPLQVHK